MIHVADVVQRDAHEQAQLVRDGSVAPDALVRAAFERIDEFDGAINCLVSERREGALRDAGRVSHDAPFRGVPALVKDLGCPIAGEPIGNGSRVLHAARFLPRRDSEVVRRLREAGFVLLGRTNTAEFGATIATEPEVTGPTRNPSGLSMSAGGSSGGSAAAVASGMAAIAHGTDASGSVRIPAGACGVVGFKPTNGTIPLDELDFGGWNGLSSPGVFARSVRDVAAVFDLLRDATPSPIPKLQATHFTVLDVAAAGHAENRIALDVVESALRAVGYRTSRAVPSFMADHRAFHRRFVAAVGLGLAADLDQWGKALGLSITVEDLEPGTRALATIGAALDAESRVGVLRWMQDIGSTIARWWDAGTDVLVTPILADGPTKLGWYTDTERGGMRVRDAMRFTPYFNVSGDPAIAVPVHRTPDGLPLGVQLVARRGSDALLLDIAEEIETTLQWNSLDRRESFPDYTAGGRKR